jgi:hypothetical protein
MLPAGTSAIAPIRHRVHSPEAIARRRRAGSALSLGRVDSIPSFCGLSPNAVGRQKILGAQRLLWVGNGRSSPEERGSANRTRAVGGVKSVSRFELQGKTHEASTYAQTGVNADGGTLDGPIGSRR